MVAGLARGALWWVVFISRNIIRRKAVLINFQIFLRRVGRNLYSAVLAYALIGERARNGEVISIAHVVEFSH